MRLAIAGATVPQGNVSRRLEAAKQIKLSEVPVVRLSEMSEAERRAYVIADNMCHPINPEIRNVLAAWEVRPCVAILSYVPAPPPFSAAHGLQLSTIGFAAYILPKTKLAYYVETSSILNAKQDCRKVR